MPTKKLKVNLFIHVNPVGSKFAKALQQAVASKINGRVLRTGRSREPVRTFSVTTNPLNKIEQFRRFSETGTSCPAFATSRDAARQINAKTLFARTLINSTNGRGIVEFERNSEQYPNAPLYTEYIPKKSEFRFHVFGDKVIDVQEKRKKRGFEDERNTRVRNVANGYVYCRDSLNIPNGASDLAVRAVQALGYKYGAVDIIYNEKRNQSFVLEVNSRPGLMGTTLDKYADALIDMYKLERK